MRLARLSLLVFLLWFTALHAQQPTAQHAQLSTVSASGQSLSSIVENAGHTASPVWIGYAVPASEGFHSGSGGDSVQYLEGGGHVHNNGNYRDNTFDHFEILLRLTNGHLDKLALSTPDRTLDAGGLRLVWIDHVSPEDSLHFLAATAQNPGNDQVRNDAIFFASLHQLPGTTPTLVALASASSSLETREKAAFWLANRRGHEGFLAIQQFARHDADPAFREKLTFDLTLCKDNAESPYAPALDELIRMAREDSSPQVRRQAQFWMATLGGQKVEAILHDRAEHDPDSDLRQSAVFAISRLPNGKATPGLIQLAQNSSDPGVRRQAIFWLGQSKDLQAFTYLEHLLKN